VPLNDDTSYAKIQKKDRLRFIVEKHADLLVKIDELTAHNARLITENTELHAKLIAGLQHGRQDLSISDDSSDDLPITQLRRPKKRKFGSDDSSDDLPITQLRRPKKRKFGSD
jgi:hypothetical protein